jgi:hypothetical protein
MKKNQNAKKEVKRDTKLEIRMSKEEKELFYKYAEDLGINPSRLARNILLSNAESIINKYYGKYWIKGYIKTLELLKDKEALERLKSE